MSGTASPLDFNPETDSRLGEYRKAMIKQVMGGDMRTLPLMLVLHRDFKRCDEALHVLARRGITGTHLYQWYQDISGGKSPRQVHGSRVQFFEALIQLIEVDRRKAHASDVNW